MVTFSVMSLLVLALQTNTQSTFSQIDISRTTGNGTAIKDAAVKACGAELAATELQRRDGLARTTVSDFLNPKILEAMRADNFPLLRALNCQKLRTNLLRSQCTLQASIKNNQKCETELFTRQVNFGVRIANRNCAKVNETLFVNIGGATEPKPDPNPPRPCGAPPQPRQAAFSTTTKFSALDITRTPGTGVQAKTAAASACSANLSAEELAFRGRLAFVTNNRFFNKQIKAANLTGNVPLVNALKCQKVRNQILASECFAQSALRFNSTFRAQVIAVQQEKTIANANTACANVDQKLFVVVPDTLNNSRNATAGNNIVVGNNTAAGSIGASGRPNAADINTPFSGASLLAFIIYLCF